MRREPGNRKREVPDSHRVADLKPAMAIGAAGLAAGVMLAGGISTVAAPESHAQADVAVSQPPVPRVASDRLTSADIATRQLPPAGPGAIVITDNPGDGHGPRAVIITGSDPGPGPGPKAVIITGSDPGPGPGPKAVVVPGGDPGNGNGPKAIVIGDPGGDGPGPKAVIIPGGVFNQNFPITPAKGRSH